MSRASPPFASLSLHGRRALITGSAQGIGSAIAQAFASAGADVAIHHLNEDSEARACAAACAAHHVKTTIVKGDLQRSTATRRIFSAARRALRGIDIVVLNASLQIPKPWLELTAAEVRQHYEVNYRSSLELLQLATPEMIERKWGRILTIGSVQEKVPHPDMLAYSSLKLAQTGLIMSLARQLAPSGITANNLAPGVVETSRNRERLRNARYKAQVQASIPLDRLGTGADCAQAALFLCSDAGSYITGQSLFVDGGLSLS